jgi:hypothetical protein
MVALTLAGAGELELTLFHIYSSTPEAHTFCFEPQSLFHGGIAPQLDFSSRA